MWVGVGLDWMVYLMGWLGHWREKQLEHALGRALMTDNKSP